MGPYQYGIVERTFNEYKSGRLSTTLISGYDTLPDDLKRVAAKASYESADLAGKDGQTRTRKQLSKAAALAWKDDDPATKTLKIINQT